MGLNSKVHDKLGKCISYYLSLGDFIEKCRFPIVLGAFLGLIQKIRVELPDAG
jgi:hypothetical protein